MRLALLSSYSLDGTIPVSTLDYISELCKYFDDVIILRNEGIISTKALQSVPKKVQFIYQKNIGRDFWQFYQYLMKYDTSKYDAILYTNDSVLLTRPIHNLMQRIYINQKEYLWVCEGMLTLKDKAKKEFRYSFVESWFIYTKWTTKDKVVDYIKQKGIELDKNNLIYEYEVWLSQEFVNQRDTYISTAKLFAIGCYPHKLWDNNKPDANWPFIPSYRRPKQLLDCWSPFIKYKFDNEWYISNYKTVIEYLSNIIY